MPNAVAPTTVTQAPVTTPMPEQASSPSVTISDGLIILATLLGPILAVQAQKLVETWKERKNRKLYLFQQLMATRAARLSPAHVQALNMIDLTFYSGRTIGRTQSAKEKAVTDAWREYLDHLSEDHGDRFEAAATRREDLFINLLHAITKDVGYDFNRVELAKNIYSPIGQNVLETEQEQVRKLVLEVLAGKAPLSVRLETDTPTDAPAQQAG